MKPRLREAVVEAYDEYEAPDVEAPEAVDIAKASPRCPGLAARMKVATFWSKTGVVPRSKDRLNS